MEIKGKVHCLFEQSGTFKNEFLKLGIKAEDYDIENEFGETDHVVDLFKEIDKAYDKEPSIFDNMTKDDLLFAFFPCIYFCDAKGLMFKGKHNSLSNWPIYKLMDYNINLANTRNVFFVTLMKLVSITQVRELRLIIENPWNNSGMTYLQNNFVDPTIVDKNRALRGDYFVKPTAYWFFGCVNTNGFTEQRNMRPKLVYKQFQGTKITGKCDAARSAISPDYARNFICDFILGRNQFNSQISLF